MKKFRMFFTALILTLSIASVPSEVIDNSALNASAEATEVISNENEQYENAKEDNEDNSPSKTVSALIIIGLFTVTFAVSGVFTYKLRRKNSPMNQDKSDHV